MCIGMLTLLKSYTLPCIQNVFYYSLAEIYLLLKLREKENV